VSTTPSRNDITWVRGQTEEWTLSVFNADGSPSDLSTNLGIELEVKQFRGQADPAQLTLSQGDGITVRSQVGADVGVCDVVATLDQTFALTAGVWQYDVFVTRSDGARKCVMYGNLKVEEVVDFP
jgi:hypothetical protein